MPKSCTRGLTASSACTIPVDFAGGLILQAKSTPLTLVLVDRDNKFLESGSLGAHDWENLVGDILCQPFGCRIIDRQEAAVFRWENPATVFEIRLDFSLGLGNLNRGVRGGQQDVVIQLRDDLLKCIAEGNEVDHVGVFVQPPSHLAGDAVVVAMQTFANIVAKRDEMRSAEDELFFLNGNGKR